MSKNSASVADIVWFRIKTINSVNLRKFISGPMWNAQGISRIQNSKILARLHDISKITLHFLCCKPATSACIPGLPIHQLTMVSVRSVGPHGP
uniref:Uncharacterized protein n=1 Tax=Arundo donax TaxID=35708 RepID=A0A0A9HU59_ARUDO